MIAPEPMFLQGSAGALFSLYIPATSRSSRGVVLLPPFAEEMNLSRRMLRLQASALAERGIAALVLDPFGTGDSAGNFDDALWETWISDVCVAVDALHQRGCSQIGLLGVRLSGMLAAAVARQLDDPCFATVLWQPVALGRTYLNELLRISRMTSISRTRPPPAIVELRSLFEKDETVEIAGYAVNSRLAAALDTLDLVQLGSPKLGPVTWVEVRHESTPVLSITAERCAASWRTVGMIVEARSVSGVPFWSGQGNRVVSNLITVTGTAFTSVP
jgi:exosortase A-associated hydrolase 2